MIERSTDFIESIDNVELLDVKSNVDATEMQPKIFQKDYTQKWSNSQEAKIMEDNKNLNLASCNIPSQPYEPSIDDQNSLVCGTVFPDLSMPYTAGWHLYDMEGEV